MATEFLTIQVDAEAAEAFKAAPPEEKRKIEVLLSLWLKELAAADTVSLKNLMNDISSKAEERGLTPQVLDCILNGK